MERSSNLNFKVSSPGKVILHGEHSVVYGKTALAGVIGAANTLQIEEIDCDLISFNFETLGLVVDIEVVAVNELLGRLENELKNDENENHAIILEKVFNFIRTKINHELVSNKREENTLTSLLYLLAGIFLENKTLILRNGFRGHLTSEIKIGAGLGSSASFGVCLSAAFFILSGNHERNFELTQESKEFISKWAFNSEKIMHGKPSGVDNTICTFGNIVEFSKGQTPKQIVPKFQISILLVDSRVDRSTAALVAKVASLKNQFPKLIDHILNGMDEVVMEAIKLYETMSSDDEEGFNKLEKLFQINNDLLKSIGVSHPKLEEIFSIASKYGFSAKLTGAGGGGYVIIPLKNKNQNAKEFKSLCTELNDHNFGTIETKIGGNGLILEWL